jgi:hypothetical protein
LGLIGRQKRVFRAMSGGKIGTHLLQFDDRVPLCLMPSKSQSVCIDKLAAAAMQFRVDEAAMGTARLAPRASFVPEPGNWLEDLDQFD